MSEHKRVVVYQRVSSDDKDQRPERQVENLKAWADRNGAEITGWVVDEGTSARKVSPLQRQKVHEAIRLAKRTDATALLVEHLDRWCRTGNRDLAATDFRMEHEHGLDVVMVDMPEGLEGMAYEIIRTVKAEYAKEFSDLLGQRIKQGLALAKKEGWPKGEPGPKPKKPLSKDEVEQIAAWKAEGVGWRRVAHKLSQQRGAFDYADPKLQRRHRVSDAWVRLRLSERAKSGCPIARSLSPQSNGVSANLVENAQPQGREASA